MLQALERLCQGGEVVLVLVLVLPFVRGGPAGAVRERPRGRETACPGGPKAHLSEGGDGVSCPRHCCKWISGCVGKWVCG